MIDAVIEIVAEKGFGGLVLGEIGTRAGYSTTLPLHYFKTREAVILLTAERIIADYSEIFRREVQGESGLTALRAFISTYLRYARENPAKRRALFMITGDAAVNSSLRQSIAKLSRKGAASVAKLIRDGQETGDIEPMIDPDTVGTLIFAWLRGAISLWAVDPALDLERLGVAMEGAVVRMLRNRESPTVKS